MMRHLVLAGAFCSLAACSTAVDPWAARELRSASDLPVQFVTEDGVMPEDACRNPLIDPRDQTRLRLSRSASSGRGQIGDYEVTGGRYGVGQNELLRINCGTGEALGIVRS